MNLKSTRFPLHFFVVTFLLALLPLSVIVVNMAGASAPLAVPSAPSTAGDWPMYGHDQSRTNYNPDETTISAANVNQLVSRWQVPIASGTPPATTTSSSPSVANGKVYVGSSAPTGPNFFSFDAVTGAPAWSKNLGYYHTCFNVGIGASPAISGNVVVAGGGDQPSVAYYGLDATTGAQLWRVPLNAGSSAFAWASPLIANGRTYLGVSSRCDNPSVRGEVRGVDYTSGLNPASAYFVNAGQAGGGVWNSPALSPDGSILVAATGEDYNCNPCTYVRSIVTMDPATMNILQSNKQGADNGDQDFGSTPIIFHDSQNRTLVGAHLKSGGAPADFFTYVLTDVNGGPIWRRNTSLSVGMMDAYDPTFGSGGTLFIFGGSSTLYAVDPATGQDRWSPVSVGTPAHANMAVANGLIFINLGGSGLQIRSEANGSLLRTLNPTNAGAANSGVAVSNGFV
ncbi:MAG: PQQ-binding-like beta-propeller repeat protein, partial [Chloroflexota bacterium]